MSKNQLSTADFAVRGDVIYISLITYMEVLGFAFEDKKEEQFIEKLFAGTPILPITDAIAAHVIHYRKQRKIKLPDAILLATARENNCKLVIRNVDDFINLDPQVEIINPFEK